MAFTGGTPYNLKNYIYNYASYSTLLQMRNTTSTDLAYKEDKRAEKLYINWVHRYYSLENDSN